MAEQNYSIQILMKMEVKFHSPPNTINVSLITGHL